MKTYEEKAQSVLNRIEEEKEIKRKRNRTISKVVTPIMSVCLVILIGVGAMNSGLMKLVQVQTEKDVIITSNITESDKAGSEMVKNSNADNNVPEQTPANGTVDNSSDMLGLIVRDGKFYIQDVDANVATYSQGAYLGKASDYEGYYKFSIDGDLYQSAEDETILLVFLENGAVVVLKENMLADGD